MIFDFHREALVRWIKGWPLRHCPGFQNAVQLETKIVVQAACGVLLDDEEERATARNDLRTRLRRNGELSLGSVAIEGLLLHWSKPGSPVRTLESSMVSSHASTSRTSRPWAGNRSRRCTRGALCLPPGSRRPTASQRPRRRPKARRRS